MKIKTITVTSLNKYLGKLIKGNAIFSRLSVEGETSNIRVSKSGYTYFTLSDEISSINCIYFGKSIEIKNGDKLVVHGRLNIYEAKGSCQIVVNSYEKIGIGNVLAELKKLKEKLQQEGAFDEKRSLPNFPTKIGIITSHTGAALQDVLQTFRFNKVKFDITVYNSLVQGKAAIEDIRAGINYFNEKAETCNVILLTRGGGSFEDLDVFNSIDIAESILLSKVPIITGIGHETDITIADYVSDKSLHTPTAAANFLSQRQISYIDKLDKYRDKCIYHMENSLNKKKLLISQLHENLLVKNPRKQYMDKLEVVEKLRTRLDNSMGININEKRCEIDSLHHRLLAFDINRNLLSGFSIVLEKDSDEILTREDFFPGKDIRVLLDTCEITAEIKDVKEINKKEC